MTALRMSGVISRQSWQPQPLFQRFANAGRIDPHLVGLVRRRLNRWQGVGPEFRELRRASTAELRATFPDDQLLQYAAGLSDHAYARSAHAKDGGDVVGIRYWHQSQSVARMLCHATIGSQHDAIASLSLSLMVLGHGSAEYAESLHTPVDFGARWYAGVRWRKGARAVLRGYPEDTGRHWGAAYVDWQRAEIGQSSVEHLDNAKPRDGLYRLSQLLEFGFMQQLPTVSQTTSEFIAWWERDMATHAIALKLLREHDAMLSMLHPLYAPPLLSEGYNKYQLRARLRSMDSCFVLGASWHNDGSAGFESALQRSMMLYLESDYYAAMGERAEEERLWHDMRALREASQNTITLHRAMRAQGQGVRADILEQEMRYNVLKWKALTERAQTYTEFQPTRLGSLLSIAAIAHADYSRALGLLEAEDEALDYLAQRVRLLQEATELADIDTPEGRARYSKHSPQVELLLQRSSCFHQAALWCLDDHDAHETSWKELANTFNARVYGSWKRTAMYSVLSVRDILEDIDSGE